jgi:hypothetical protein
VGMDTVGASGGVNTSGGVRLGAAVGVAVGVAVGDSVVMLLRLSLRGTDRLLMKSSSSRLTGKVSIAKAMAAISASSITNKPVRKGHRNADGL